MPVLDNSPEFCNFTITNKYNTMLIRNGLVYLLSLACALPRLHAAKRPKTLRLKFDEVDAISDESWVAINGIYNAGDDRLFILDQTGVIKIYDTKSKTMASTVPFLDITAMTDTGNLKTSGYSERGLLGLAFHPSFEDNQALYISFTNLEHATVIAKYVTDAGNPDVVDLTSYQEIISYPQPYSNHNGGFISFGTDGFLYISSGDGGSQQDPHDYGDDLSSFHAKILRIDVDTQVGDKMYGIPASNPFAVGIDDSIRPEIWSYGLRNPWGLSFDKEGNFYFADVGQDQFEEWNFAPASDKGGRNYGWSHFEGESCLITKDNITQTVCDDYLKANDVSMPQGTYHHGGSPWDGNSYAHCSITGGVPYQPKKKVKKLKHLENMYIYGDFCSGYIWGATRERPDEVKFKNEVLADTPFSISAIGEDSRGSVYVADYGSNLVQGYFKSGKPGVHKISKLSCFDDKTFKVKYSIQID
uniref:Glucose/Sorbosone dehydrogenase domain-containing protein n=3 Tax=Corethron hystrix TaxID=216773 RepID=A0A7S1BSC6_9STRA|mmetsp:Transcript_39365/g.91885  ORF Transcript_39365/g.91885 Transcript_39365/m.91885 type:complete len:472 (+) Transcript_39365:129-1544(+)